MNATQITARRLVRSSGCVIILLAMAVTISLAGTAGRSDSILGPFTKTIDGTVYDHLGSAVDGVNVKVDIWVGDWPLNFGVLSGSRTTASDAWGHYEVSFDANEWSPHYVIEILGTKDITVWTENAEANGDAFQTIDLDSSSTIPEFSGPEIMVLTVSASAAFFVLITRRKRV